MKKDTQLGHLGRNPRETHGTVNMPVYRASTIVFPDLETYSTRPGDDYKIPRYGIHGTPSNWALEEAVAKLEGGYNAVAVCSGLSRDQRRAVCVRQELAAMCWSPTASTGRRAIFATSVWRHLAWTSSTTILWIGSGSKKFNKIKYLFAIFCEAPGSLSFEMQDIPAIAREAHARDIPVLADTTWGTPYFFKSFEHGVDVSIHAATKYIVGHSDVMMGMIVTNEKYWLPLRRTVADYGYCSSADDCYLALRGLRTIGVRMKQQMANAHHGRALAGVRVPKSAAILFPALESDPGPRHLETRFRRRCIAVFDGIEAGRNRKQIAAFVEHASSCSASVPVGAVIESLVTAPNITHLRTATQWPDDGPVIRLHIGLEDPDDLIADLEQALVKMMHAPPDTMNRSG